ncbi:MULTISPECIES: dephospho-CoA kinase [Nitrincola]|uniref:Dephospho-CoA kinase n=1 Tax=Nitrincola nitratireducens TaxID=1229521 RepID=W9V9L0_9GAMM|nr:MULTISPECIES: dephospho-CoA kinase [Nitrincola]EXJ12752.1 Dephospho-CoA kinase [Nitrincola nitratireducens]
MNWVVGLTGGIGSGKTAASDYLETLGVSIIDADKVARSVVAPGSFALAQIAEHFGEQSINQDGHLNRRYLRSVIFDQPEEKDWLEALLHPMIRSQILMDLQAPSSSPYVVLVSPLLLETDQWTLADKIVIIDVPEALQLARSASRDQASIESIQKIMSQQLSRVDRLNRADFIIDNSQTLTELHQQLANLHSTLQEQTLSKTVQQLSRDTRETD